MKVITGAISHETSTFTPIPTAYGSFEERFGHIPMKDEVTRLFAGTNTPTGGFYDGAEAHDFELVPTLYANAQPSGPTPRGVFDAILGEMLDRMADAMPADGVLLELHGSMVAEGIDDAEGHILAAVRNLVGPHMPVVGQLDIHSNVSRQMVEAADVLIGRETYPEVDMAERGRECADVLVRIVQEGLRPTMALCQIPMIWGTEQVTAHPPMRDAIEELHRIEAQSGVVCGSIATSYPLADVPDLGASVTIVTDGDGDLAQSYADQLGDWLFDRRSEWHGPMPSTREALQTAEAAGRYPVIFADRNDNTGGGSPGDSTGMLRAFLDAGLEDACLLYIVDPEAVAQCSAAGASETVTLDVGGKSSPLQGLPVPMTAEVIALSDGSFRYDGPMLAGMDGSMGPSAHIRHDGLHVVLTTVREQPFDTAFSRTLGLDPREMRYIGVKSTAHFRAGFESWAGAIHVVSEPGVHDPVTAGLTFERRGRKLYPMDDV
ncbi:MAG: M81 family metallopeptidase [Candidatus Latescibacteria bacterium]|jgi:microcystin degradation protein MlrC|nr:M81 family metallopeptidase [Candidatus Latescibacterota bacterium]